MFLEYSKVVTCYTGNLTLNHLYHWKQGLKSKFWVFIFQLFLNTTHLNMNRLY